MECGSSMINLLMSWLMSSTRPAVRNLLIGWNYGSVRILELLGVALMFTKLEQEICGGYFDCVLLPGDLLQCLFKPIYSRSLELPPDRGGMLEVTKITT
ncbi:hypothetical protein WN944_026719 [Citrus x changshan-huyou]|uniref:Uncharacterized protein n=1 Tax=Citrus x changshan-huyou TaxID=2935761 RepID=A0AAP0LVL9_9ROSI